MRLSTLSRVLPALLAVALAAAPLAQPRAVLNTTLSGDNEVPAVMSNGEGQVFGSLDGDQLTVFGFFTGLDSPFNTDIGAHIHGGAANENGGVVVPLTVALSDDGLSGLFRPYDNTFTVRSTFADSIRAGLAYVNVHSQATPSGEIRGQITAPEFYINEVRIDQPGGDDDEFVEIVGTPLASLDGITFLSIGDGSGGQGVIEAVLDLSGNSLPADGYFVIAEDSFGGGTSDLIESINLENGQSSTFLLVRGFSGANGDDLDTDDDGEPDVAPWSELVHVIGAEADDEDDIVYGEALGGLDASFNASPGRVFVTDEGYPGVGLYPLGLDTPGVANGDTSPMQIVHNAPDPAADVVDIYANDLLAFNNVPFRGATTYFEVPTGVSIEFAVTDDEAADASAPLVAVTGVLDDGVTFQVYAQGVADPMQFAANPDGVDTDLELALNTSAQFYPSTLTDVALNVVHGAPDAPTVKVVARNVGDVTDFLEYTDVTTYAEVAPGAYVLDVVTEAGATAAAFEADLSAADGESLTILASGFLDPAANQNGPAFGLLVVDTEGNTALLDARAVATDGGALGEGLALVAQNPVRDGGAVTFSLAAPGEATLAVYDVLGRRVAVLADGPQTTEARTVRFDAGGLAAGAYVLRLETADGAVTRTVTVVR